MSRLPVEIEKMKRIIVTDCGSTTTKARLFMKKNGEWRYVISGEAPTTVEAPYEDVTLGVRNAIREIEELTGLKLLSNDGIITPSRNNEGVDLYVSTSSAGGGLQMLVFGVIKSMTAESAERAALGAGAIVMDVLSVDDGRKDHERINLIRTLRPDMILLAGGTDGGQVEHVAKFVDMIDVAEPKPRFGEDYQLPIIYAGNINVREYVQKRLRTKFSVTIVDNLRPALEVENVEPTRNAIHEEFMRHVMSHAPGYPKLMKWVHAPIMPTPYGEGMMFRKLAEAWNVNIIGVGLGGATTNIYSVFDGKFVRTVSANLGMSYSICNVLRTAGIENILRWVPFDIDEKDLKNRLRNKMIRPTTIPQTLEDLMLEHAVAREAIANAFKQHKTMARELRGVKRERTIGEIFEKAAEETYIDMMRVDVIGGTGGLLSHAPRRVQSALILSDAFQPEGVTRLIQDSVFMMPHLGVLSTVHPKAALEIFEKDCLVKLGAIIAPKFKENTRPSEGETILEVEAEMPDRSTLKERLLYNEMKLIPLKEDESAIMIIKPSRKCNVGAGFGKVIKTKIEGGVVGVILDGRGRPITLAKEPKERQKKLKEWFRALKVYPEEVLDKV